MQFRIDGSYLRPNPEPGAPAACPGYRDCLYAIPREYSIDELRSVPITYKDILGRDRTIEVTYRYPTNRPGKLPVALWAHGGGEGRNGEGGSVGAMTDWSTLSARYGYLSAAPAFRARTGADKVALCEYLSMTTEACDLWDSPAWDRPFDIKAILDWLEQQSLCGPFAGRIDMYAIGIGGHSAGSTGVLSTGARAGSSGVDATTRRFLPMFVRRRLSRFRRHRRGHTLFSTTSSRTAPRRGMASPGRC